jgi:DHA2 family multidrug resistance protein
MGLGLIALGLGTLQIVLDKGQREDWFESQYIVVLSLIAAGALVFAVFWEWRHKDPIVDLHLFRERTFATANLLMFMLGFALLGSTLLLPLFMQTLLGYTAEQAGMALTPGGFTILLLLPLVGFLLSRYDSRWLIAVGLTTLSLSLFHMTSFDLDVDFRTVMLARILQAAGLACLFVPINTAAYAFLPREKNNAASGLMNLARNIGGSVGISFVTTLLARRTQFHQARLSEHLSAGGGRLQSTLQGLTATFTKGGLDPATAAQKAYAMLQASVGRQAAMLGYIDCFWMLGSLIICLVPVAFLMKKARPGGAVAVH